MTHATQSPLRLMTAPDAVTVELLYRTFGDLLIPLDQLRARYFRNLNERSFQSEIESGRIQLPVTTLDSSRKAPKFVYIRHVAALIEASAYKADEAMARTQDTPMEDPTDGRHHRPTQEAHHHD
ncbi:pyocin activator PrtN family protein [Pseudomonas sp. SLFW]|uniref:pyocin activator PrtN family protein n=1 Tax=Pseudomonas sp. SLFW TaxID=2683259 RepID=UPI0014132B99|nr:pyocin activator PrtN family protein [Pseudomonas sp. SLFW]NBB09566.1 transcriptional regulator [Pseudomonas sp. SLFW]